ncbi:hypothetical protein RCH20_001077 [Psychrobacter sp. PL15]|uniref:hypothetical protein n=1 Tax=Psychrobacter sp. PL15 TaxID=3071719 RepID=UPI002E033C0A|nr:hypothetical protein [Psychrobacter sp. PL15]
MDIRELSEYQLYKLKSIDPNLSPDWRDVIQQILPNLNQGSQNSVRKNILEPRGIYFDVNEKLTYKHPLTLKLTLNNIQTDNKDLVPIVSAMLKIINSRCEYYDAMELADEIEAIFGYLDNLNLHNLLQEQKNRKKIRIAFLYDLAKWIDTVTLHINPGIRKLDSHMVKSYLKEVFIKQKIQGQDFRKWASSDLNFQDFTYLPPFIKSEGENRNFIIVEGCEHWFLIGSAQQSNKNPYSFRRFLHEDSSGINTKQYIYLTHVVIKKNNMHNSQYLSRVSYIMSRFYTLDRGISDTPLSFICEIQSLHNKYLKPLLKKRLEQDDGSTETIIEKRMTTYEKQVSVLILQKLPRIVQTTLRNKEDQDYLFYHLDQLIKQMIENVQDFKLQPLVMYSTSSEIMLIKLFAIRRLLAKSRNILYSSDKSLKERSEIMGIPLFTVKEKLTETENLLEELKDILDSVNKYYQIKAEGSFWQNIKLGRMPNLTLEKIAEKELAAKEALFVYIVRLAKNKNEGMVYVEFECDEMINKNYRHYALADGELGISRLPRILRLPENKTGFNIESVREVVNQNVFESYQMWTHNRKI